MCKNNKPYTKKPTELYADIDNIRGSYAKKNTRNPTYKQKYILRI